jgi:hypothetical protein
MGVDIQRPLRGIELRFEDLEGKLLSSRERIV